MMDETEAASASASGSVELFRELIESLPHMVWTCWDDGAYDYLSPQWIAYAGMPASPGHGDSWLSRLHPDDVPSTQERWAAAVAQCATFEAELRIRGVDGTYLWFKVHALPRRGSQVGRTKWILSSTRIQELREAQEKSIRLNLELEAGVRQRNIDLEAANARLHAVRAQLMTAQSLTQVGSWELDVRSGRVTWSDELFHIFLLSPKEEPPNYAVQSSLFTEESWQRLTTAVERSIQTGEGYELKLTIRRTDGEQRSAVAHAQCLKSSGGQVERLVGTFQDVTRSEHADARLHQLSERLQLATSAAKMGVWDWDLAANTLLWDDTMFSLYELERASFGAALEAWQAALHPDDAARMEATLASAVAGEASFNVTFRIVVGDGRVKHLRAAATVHRDPMGNPVRMVGVNWDVTEQRIAEISLGKEKLLQKAILSGAGSSIIATDARGVITLFNRAAEELLGYTAAEVVGAATPELIHDPAEVEARRAVLEAELGCTLASPFEVFVIKVRDGGQDANEWTYVRKDGTRVPVLLTVTSLRSEDDELIGFLGIGVNLTARKQNERELNQLNQLLAARSVQAEAASHAKSMFVANMSHEIRTPLGAITGLTYLLGRTPITVEQRNLLQTIESSTKTLLGMINDILDLSKIEAQQLALDCAPFSVTQLVDDVAGLMAGFAHGKRIELVIDAATDLPTHVMGDRVRIMQIITNLVGNAIKFTHEGSVRVVLQRIRSVADKVWLRIEVADTGVGIPAHALSSLFARFTQVPQRGGAKAGGTGLGLAIVKQLVELMDGEVGVESAVGVGSRFYCEIPFVGVRETDFTTAERVISVLVVDDHDEQRMAIAACALRLGWHVETAGTGPQMIALIADRRRRGVPFDVLVLDWHMPKMDGLSAVELMERAAATGEHVPRVIMVTGHDLAELQELPLASRAAALLKKPVTASSLFDAVSTALKPSSAEGERAELVGPHQSGLKRLPGVRILVVDDSDVNRDIASRILGLEGASVETAAHGGQAVELVATSSSPFDAILMDVQMPVLDGIEAVRRIRKLASASKIPVIALTAGALSHERDQALAAGMNDFITKPFDPEALIALVRRHVECAHGTPVGVTARDVDPRGYGAWIRVDGIDEEDVFARLGGDGALFQELLQRMQKELPKLGVFASVRPEVAEVPDLVARLHRLRGAAGNIGARDLCRTALLFEEDLRAGVADSEHRTTFLVELDRLHAAVHAALSGSHTPMRAEGQAVSLDSSPVTLLMQLLRQQDLEALSKFSELSSGLALTLDAARYAALDEAMRELHFQAALAILEDASRAGVSSGSSGGSRPD